MTPRTSGRAVAAAYTRSLTPLHYPDVDILHELIEALDRRFPQTQREGEAAIARDAAALKARALAQIAELEHMAGAPKAR